MAAVERSAAVEAEARLEAIRLEREGVDRALGELTGGSGDANRGLVALGAARERLGARRESATTLAARLADEHAAARAHARAGAPSPAELEHRANEARAAARAASTERDDLAERARSARDRLAALERSLGEREGVAPAARALAAEGERLVVSELEVEPGHEKAVAAALAWRASALLATDARHALALLERARDGGLGRLDVLLDRDAPTAAEPPVPGAQPLRSLASGADDVLKLLDGIWLVDADRLLDVSAGTAITIDGCGYDATRGELWFAGETGRSRSPRARCASPGADRRGGRAGRPRRCRRPRGRWTLQRRPRRPKRRTPRSPISARCRSTRRFSNGSLRSPPGSPTPPRVPSRRSIGIEAPLNARLTSGQRRSTELRAEVDRLAALEAEARRDAGDAVRRAADADLVVARLGGVATVAGTAERRDRDELLAAAAAALREADDAAARARSAADAAHAADAALVERAPRRSRLDVDLLRRLVGATDALGDALARASAGATRFEPPVRARVDAGATRASELGAELRRLGAAEVELRQAAEAAAETVTGIEVELARLEGEAAEARRRLDDAVSAGADAETGGRTTPRRSIATSSPTRVTRLEARRESLGRVNPLAKEEYEAEKVRLEELSTQRADLEASLHELEALRDELTETVNRRFDETFAAVAANFEEVATTLFPGGEGRLRLVEPEDGEEAEAGVEVELRPAGKRITRLTLLSGGEKALGAISFLFALFLAKPCPFYLLDEVEAALDDTNIARFVELLRRYSDRAQFVVITHQKRTMEAADVLYGVTMGGDGVSQIVSRRLPREERAAASA